MLHYPASNSATMDRTNTFVSSLSLIDGNTPIPEILFCLKKLTGLTIVNGAFSDGIVPDSLANLQQVNTIQMLNSSIMNLTNQFSSLIHLYSLTLNNCSLSEIPSLSNMPYLRHVYLDNNRLSRIEGFRTDVDCLHVADNLFTEIPFFKTPTSLAILRMNNNPLKDISSIDSFTYLAILELRNTTLISIPSTIDKLQRLYHLDLSHNKLVHLPRSIFKLKYLAELYLNNNMFSSEEIQTLRMEFSKTHPNITLRI
ncbi:unnamed protein product [Adineta ricciae]|uniref:Uncharacterized protein n=1 Tax=Adineta ricciae TaxID=249248 RepID=A0A814B9A6_ADIRI|nr:unnamed protein product [Adineta ricciae]